MASDHLISITQNSNRFCSFKFCLFTKKNVVLIRREMVASVTTESIKQLAALKSMARCKLC
ncbi:hypothetical protein NC653_010143 [Populus alba x Populus x berolinensis]|uniref:Uncharacterized protein n=1 Tax=Populus alba x Populus x berolinensis TaxID=444605 RepID=A0AAD6QZ24_9ROSI|nr:hypothetical protein NC653_010143 [Populus alba x Populus x berolinensis]